KAAPVREAAPPEAPALPREVRARDLPQRPREARPAPAPRAQEPVDEPPAPARTASVQAAPARPAVPAAPGVPGAPLDTDALDAWLAILERLRDTRPELAAMLEHAAPLEVRPEQLVVGWEPGSVFSAQASGKEALDLVTRAASEHFTARTRVVFEFDSQRAKDFETLAR